MFGNLSSSCFLRPGHLSARKINKLGRLCSRRRAAPPLLRGKFDTPRGQIDSSNRPTLSTHTQPSFSFRRSLIWPCTDGALKTVNSPQVVVVVSGNRGSMASRTSFLRVKRVVRLGRAGGAFFLLVTLVPGIGHIEAIAISRTQLADRQRCIVWLFPLCDITTAAPR